MSAPVRPTWQLTEADTLAVFHDGWAHCAPGGPRLFARWERFLRVRRNPRTLAEMEALASSTCGLDLAGHTRVLLGRSFGPEPADSELSNVLLLWPDANGTGWSRIERDILRSGRPGLSLLVLNGRGRFFILDRQARRRFLWRRALEGSMAGEVAMLACLVLVAPFLVAWDLARGRH